MRHGILLLVAALWACTPELPRPRVVPHPADVRPTIVPFPPPPARPDLIKDPPARMVNPAWIDGQWLWGGRRWAWQPGEWVDLQPNQVYALPRVVQRPDGDLVWVQGTLLDDETQSLTKTPPP